MKECNLCQDVDNHYLCDEYHDNWNILVYSCECGATNIVKWYLDLFGNSIDDDLYNGYKIAKSKDYHECCKLIETVILEKDEYIGPDIYNIQ